MGFFSALSVLAPVVGGMIGREADRDAQRAANIANAQEAQRNREFQERMSSTEIRRRKFDLEAAGFNPMLAINSAASAPSGNVAHYEPETRNNATNAMAALRLVQELKGMKLDNEVKRETVRNIEADTELKQTNAGNVLAGTNKVEIEMQLLAKDFQRKLIDLDIGEQQLAQAKLDTEQKKALQPIALELERLRLKAEQLGMTQREIDEKFAAELGMGNRVLQFLNQLIRR